MYNTSPSLMAGLGLSIGMLPCSMAMCAMGTGACLLRGLIPSATLLVSSVVLTGMSAILAFLLFPFFDSFMLVLMYLSKSVFLLSGAKLLLQCLVQRFLGAKAMPVKFQRMEFLRAWIYSKN